MFRRLFIFSFLVSVLVGCSDYSKIMKSSDYELKYQKAKEYYVKKDYMKALPLFEELLSVYRLDKKSEEIYYYYAKTNYGLKDYYMANYYLKSFARNYPESPNAQEALFLAALCSVKNSPEYSLDQSETYKALDEIQLFMDRYPESSRIDTCNLLVSELRKKLERKAYERCKLYYRTKNYNSAVVSFNAMLKDFPDTKYREEAMFVVVRSSYFYAMNSVPSKREERLAETLKFYNKFADSYPSSKNGREAETYYKNAVKELERIKEQKELAKEN
ncbi:MAG: outer membrane protein assembly factor BamD [Flavobacteriales bacterium]